MKVRMTRLGPSGQNKQGTEDPRRSLFVTSFDVSVSLLVSTSGSRSLGTHLHQLE